MESTVNYSYKQKNVFENDLSLGLTLKLIRRLNSLGLTNNVTLDYKSIINDIEELKI